MTLTSREADHIRQLTISHNELMARVEHLEKVVYTLFRWVPNFIKARVVPPRESGPNRPLNATRIDSTPDSTIIVAWDTKIHGTQPGIIDRPIRSLEQDMKVEDVGDEFG